MMRGGQNISINIKHMTWELSILIIKEIFISNHLKEISLKTDNNDNYNSSQCSPGFAICLPIPRVDLTTKAESIHQVA